jgi:hypothetical protein
MGYKARKTVDQLRFMLAGKHWSDFRRRKAYKKCRVLNVGPTFFTLTLTTFMLRPCLRIRAQEQLIALQYIDPDLYNRLLRDGFPARNVATQSALASLGMIFDPIDFLNKSNENSTSSTL